MRGSRLLPSLALAIGFSLVLLPEPATTQVGSSVPGDVENVKDAAKSDLEGEDKGAATAGAATQIHKGVLEDVKTLLGEKENVPEAATDAIDRSITKSSDPLTKGAPQSPGFQSPASRGGFGGGFGGGAPAGR